MRRKRSFSSISISSRDSEEVEERMRRKPSFSAISISSKDSEVAEALSEEDGNADLSAGIIAKACSRNFNKQPSQEPLALGTAQDDGFLNGLVLDSDVEILSSSDVERMDEGFRASRQKGAAAAANTVEKPGNLVLPKVTVTVTEQIGKDNGAEQTKKHGKKVTVRRTEQIGKDSETEQTEKDGKKKRRKKKKKKKAAVASVGHAERPVKEPLFKVIADDGDDNLVMRKLLRGPRYFDEPEEKTCFCCGNAGHFAADCTEEPRKKACYVCGNYEHEAKDCPQGSCFICKGIGHFARSCPNRANQTERDHGDDKICFRCGEVGHDMIICDRDYRPEDLKVTQCYVCKKFGHLCCLDIVESSSRIVSCYNCGELGHSGVGCAKSRGGRKDGDKHPRKLCFKCGEEGHFARGCRKADEDDLWPDPRTPDMRKLHADEGFYGFKSVPTAVGAHPRWLDMQLAQRHARTPGVSRWPDRWSMATETDRWANFEANGMGTESPTVGGNTFKEQVRHDQSREEYFGGRLGKRQKHSARKADGNSGHHHFLHENEFDTPGRGRSNFKRNRYDRQYQRPDSGRKRFW